MAGNKKDNKERSGWWNTVVVASIVSALGLGDGKATAKDNNKVDNIEKGKIENFDKESSKGIDISKVKEQKSVNTQQDLVNQVNEIMKKNPKDRTLAEYIVAREYYNGKNKHLAKANEKIQQLESQAVATMQNLMEKGISAEEMKSVERFMEIYPKTDKYNTSVKDKFAEYVANMNRANQETVGETTQDKGYVVGSHLANAIGGRNRTRVSYSRFGVTHTPLRSFMGGYTFSTTSNKGTEVNTTTANLETSNPNKTEVDNSKQSEADNTPTATPKKKSWFARLFSRKEANKEDTQVKVEDNPKHAKVAIAQPWYQTFKFDSNNPDASFKEWAEKAGKPMSKDKIQMAINVLPDAYKEVGAHIRRWTEHAYKKGYQMDWNELPKNYKKELAEAHETYAQQSHSTQTRSVYRGGMRNRVNRLYAGRRGDITGGKWNLGRW